MKIQGVSTKGTIIRLMLNSVESKLNKNEIAINCMIMILLVFNIFSFMKMIDTSYSKPIELALYLLIIIFFFQNNKFRLSKDLMLTIFISLFVLFSFLNNNFAQGRIAMFIVPLSLMILFVVLRKIRITSAVYYIFILFTFYWVVIPFFLYLLKVPSMFYNEYGKYNLLKGFALHYNHFGYGVVFLLLISINSKMKSNLIKILISSILFYILWLTQSRSSVLAACVSVLYLLVIKLSDNRVYRAIGFFIITMLLVYGIRIWDYYSPRPIGDFFDSVRYDLFIETIRSGSNIFYGSGRHLSDVISHNFVLQNYLDYGAIASFSFLILLAKHFFTLKYQARLFVIAIVIIGLFQPELTIEINSTAFIFFLGASYYDNYYIMLSKN